MTDDQIIQAACTDPIVRRARGTPALDGTFTPPDQAELRASAATELEMEIRELLDDEALAMALMENEYALTLSGGTDVAQGTCFTLPDSVDQITAITVGSTRREVDIMTSRRAFNHWWSARYSQQDLSNPTEVVIEWDKTATGKRTLLFSPGVGSDTTAYLLNRRTIGAYSVSMFRPDDHYLPLLGLKNRLSGGQFELSYDRARARIARRVAAIAPQPVPARRDPRHERLAWKLNRLYAGGSGDPSPYYRLPSSP